MRRFDIDQLPTGSYSISGSFSGSFQGDGSNLTGILTDPFPYTGSARITGSLDLIGPFTTDNSISSPTSITFDINNPDADAEARLKWNDTEGTLDLGMGGGSATLQMGQELYYPKVVNKSGENLINGTLVMVDPAQPAQGNRLRVVRAVTDGTYPSELIVGPLTEDIDDNQEGFATWFGYVRQLNRTDLENNGIKDPNDTWVEGTILYTNPNLDGGYTSSMQPAPAGKSSIAAVTAVNGQNITILVRPKLDTNVGSLHDVTDLTTTSSYGDLFIKSGDIWSTGKSLSGSYSLSGSLTATEISGSFSGSFQGDGSGLTGVGVDPFPYTGSAQITGSLGVIGPTTLTYEGVPSLVVYGSGSADAVFIVSGSSGELFTVTDSTTGDLFTVTDADSNAIFNISASYDIYLGNPIATSLYTTTTASIGSTPVTIYSIPTASYEGAWFEYTIRSGSNSRAGQIMSIWDSTSVNFTETTTVDFGDTSGVDLGVLIIGNNISFTGSATTDSWSLRTIIRSI